MEFSDNEVFVIRLALVDLVEDSTKYTKRVVETAESLLDKVLFKGALK